MNPFAYRTTGLAIKAFSWLSKANIRTHGAEHIPAGSLLFVINHFTRIETLLMPYFINQLTGTPVWSLADFELFKGPLGSYLDQVGAVSTRDPDRDRLIVKTLLTGESAWIIYPEGRMVKNKKLVEKGHYMISFTGGKHPPHTGAATLALRTEFYRQRLRHLHALDPNEAQRLLAQFGIDDITPVINRSLFIVPVNLTYYPIRAKENILTTLARRFKEGLPERLVEELMAEGTMFLSGVDIDMHFGEPIAINRCLSCPTISQDIRSGHHIDFDEDIDSRRQMRREALQIMQRYMDAIYGMTTVNHDHLFASLLRLAPFKRIHPDDLRRKVYLAAIHCLSTPGVHLHRSLREDQLHLLTDDRYNKYRDFLNLARETEVVAIQDDWLHKDATRLTTPFAFHRIRRDNPVRVMANEIEPLKKLQRCLRRIAWQPAFLTRRRLAGRLQKEAEEAFSKDYATYHIEGESKDPSIGRPFLLRGRARRLGVVLMHGYMAAPEEVRELARFIQRKGYWVYAPRVPGHGTAPEDLASRSYQEWVQAVDAACALMACHCRRVVVGGFSNGAGLALEAASRLQAICGVFAVSPPLRLQDFSARFVPAVDIWNRLMKRIRTSGAVKEFIANEPENRHINYVRNPIAGIRELERLMDKVEERLQYVRVPAVVVQSAGDPVVDPRGSRRVFDLIGSEDKKYMLFNFDRHGILRGQGAAKVHRVIGNFLDDLDSGAIT
ncbi:MAG: alpha/beta fold hydrolase [Desulfobacterales bacterium]|nr:alpha/beta fold hydrolase [Desulfobacterales bacterium]